MNEKPRTQAEIQDTADEIADLLGLDEVWLSIDRGNIVLTNAQARRLLVLARAGKAVSDGVMPKLFLRIRPRDFQPGDQLSGTGTVIDGYVRMAHGGTEFAVHDSDGTKRHLVFDGRRKYTIAREVTES